MLIFALVALAGCSDQQLTSSLDKDSTVTEPDTSTPDSGPPDVGPDTTPAEDTKPPDPDTDDTCLQTTPQQASEFADDFSTALCEKLLSCENNSSIAEFVTFGGWSSVDACAREVQAGLISPGQAQKAAEQGSLTLNSCEASDCLQQIPNLDCLGVHRALLEARYDEMASCYGAWQGARAAGSPCTVDAQCQGDRVCTPGFGSTSCTGSCNDPGQSGSGQCGDIVCRHDQYCSFDNDVCMSRGAIGDDCEQNFECTLDAYCDDTGKCVAIDTGRGLGETCNDFDELCSFDFACIDGECSDFVGEGDSCSFVGCDAGLFCNQNSQCEALRGDFASCENDGQCLSFRCADGECTPVDDLCPDDT
jgi:hypothetical protein